MRRKQRHELLDAVFMKFEKNRLRPITRYGLNVPECVLEKALRTVHAKGTTGPSVRQLTADLLKDKAPAHVINSYLSALRACFRLVVEACELERIYGGNRME